jgi:hypothetical protein
MKAFVAVFLIVTASALPSVAGLSKISGQVGKFRVQPGEDVGVEIESSLVTLIRLCQPLKPGVDVNYYLYHRLNLAHERGDQVNVIYEERMGRDPVTGRNKLCLVELIY